MPKVLIYDFNGETVGEMELSDTVFGIEPHVPVMHRVVVAQLASKRQGTHSTKTRGEVRGGGRKPWRQKHTGRARHGSIRSPIWVGGGVVHGPKPRDYSHKVNKKERKLAIKSALSAKVRDGKLFVVEDIQLQQPSTKKMAEFLQKIGADKKPLLVLHERMDNVYKSMNNIANAKAMNVSSINVYDVLNYNYLIMTKEAVKKIEEVYR